MSVLMKSVKNPLIQGKKKLRWNEKQRREDIEDDDIGLLYSPNLRKAHNAINQFSGSKSRPGGTIAIGISQFA